MLLAVLAPLDVAGVLDLGLASEGIADVLPGVGLQLAEAGTADRRGGVGEGGLHDFIGQPDRLEDLGAAVAGHVRDAHLGHDLEHAVLDRRAEALLGGRRVAAALDLSLGAERGDRLEREARADRLAAVAEQGGEVMRLARLVALDQDRAARPQLGPHQFLVSDAHGKQDRDRRSLGRDAGVADQEEPLAFANGLTGLGGKPLAGGLQSLVLREGGIEMRTFERGQSVGIEEEAVQLDQTCHLGPLGEERGPSAE